MIELKSAVCPECGGRLIVDALSPSMGKCQSCGYTTVIAGVPGFNAEKAAWINAMHQLEDGDIDRADKYFAQILATKPNYGEAYLGRFECAVAVALYYRHLNAQMARCVSDYMQAIDEAVTKYGKRAIQYAADEETRQSYQARIDEVLGEMQAWIEQQRPKKRGFFRH